MPACPEASWSFFFENITHWGERVIQFIRCAGFSLCETHLAGADAKTASRRLRQLGFRSIWLDAEATGNGGTSGGIVVIFLASLAVHELGYLPDQPTPEQRLNAGRGSHILAVKLRLHKSDVLLCGAYLDSRLGLSGRNAERSWRNQCVNGKTTTERRTLASTNVRRCQRRTRE